MFDEKEWLAVSLGYGDLYPSTTSGRGEYHVWESVRWSASWCLAIAGMVGLVGILSSALLIAVVSQKLSFRREEKYVHTFVLNIELAKKRRIYAANVVKFAIKAWFLRQKDRRKSIQYLQAHRKLFSAISNLQQVKKQQSGLVDNCVGLHELMTSQRSTGDQMDDTVVQIAEMKMEINKIDTQIQKVNQTLNTLQTTLNILLEKMKWDTGS